MVMVGRGVSHAGEPDVNKEMVAFGAGFALGFICGVLAVFAVLEMAAGAL